MNIFTDLDAASEEAQWLADNEYIMRKRRAGYVLEYAVDDFGETSGYLVSQHNAKKRLVVALFTPTPKPRVTYSNNKTGHTGISRTSTGRLKAVIKRNGKHHYVGIYDTMLEAVARRVDMLKALGG